MRAVGFDYGNTCPRIDKAISRAKAEIESFLDNLLEEACPFLDSASRSEIAIDYTGRLYADLEDIFEEPRRENEKMRAEADRQISDLKDEIANLETELQQEKA